MSRNNSVALGGWCKWGAVLGLGGESGGCSDRLGLVEYWTMKYRVYLEPDEDGVFVATCPALPGCVSEGRTRIEAMENIREAIEGYLESLWKHGDPLLIREAGMTVDEFARLL